MCKIVCISLTLILMSTGLYAQSLYHVKGKGSYYGNEFKGRNTASGEKFDPEKLTAAHRTLPFGTRLKVTNLRNNKAVIVIVNDRGPFVSGRIIDVSRAAADSLGMLAAGWTEMDVEELPPSPIDDEPTFAFPRVWAGDWKGDLKIYSAKGIQKIIPMELQIHPTQDASRYSWIIIYMEEPRNYELVIHDSVQHLYSIDEKDGIDIMGSLFSNQFTCRFSIEGSLLECVYTLKSIDEMSFEIRAGNSDHSWSTGNIVTATDTIPPVNVYDVSSFQKATL